MTNLRFGTIGSCVCFLVCLASFPAWAFTDDEIAELSDGCPIAQYIMSPEDGMENGVGDRSESWIADLEGCLDAELIQSDSQVAFISYVMSLVTFRRNNVEEALRYAGNAIEREPDRVEYLWFRALVFQTEGEHRSALADYLKLIEIDPDDLRYYNGAVYTASKQDDLKLAKAVAFDAVERFDRSIDSLLIAAMALFLSHDFEGALQLSEEVLSSDPGNQDAIDIRASTMRFLD